MTIYSQKANPNATNSELDAKVIITPDHVTLNQNVNKYPRLNDDEWDETKWEHFCRYNDGLDKIRGREDGWREIFPELISLCAVNGSQHRY